MMYNFHFETLDYINAPSLELANPERKVIGILRNYTDADITIRFNALSELTFTILSKNNNQKNPYYDLVKKDRLIHIKNFGWWVIDSVREENEGTAPYKQVSCLSYEQVLNFKNINLNNGTYTLDYNETDSLEQKEKTIRYHLEQSCVGWNFVIDSDLTGKYRTFEISDSTIYSFLMNDMEQAFHCIVTFDTEHKIIHIDSATKIVTPTDIYLSHRNLIKSVEVEELSNSVVTALSVHGSDDITIANVNPTGGTLLYNFSYYKPWMSEELQKALSDWENKINENTERYSTRIGDLRRAISELADLKSSEYDRYNDLAGQLSEVKWSDPSIFVNNMGLSQIESLKKSAEVLQSSFVGESQFSTKLSTVTSNIAVLNTAIAQKNILIDNKNTEVTNIRSELVAINDALSITNTANFSEKLFAELDSYIRESSYTNENYVKTSVMTEVEIQDMCEDLRDQGKAVLDELCHPTYRFSLEAMNMLYIKKFKPFVRQLCLGKTVYAEINKGEVRTPILLEASISLSDPSSFSLTFGDNYKLRTDEYQFADLVNDISKTTNKVSVSAFTWGNNSKEVSDLVSYKNNALDLTRQEIIASQDQSFTMGDYGLRGRKLNDNGLFDTNEIWITSNKIAFTEDNWQTSKSVFGRINFGSESDPDYKHGIIAENIIGNLLAGSKLTIQSDVNENASSFRVDGNGVSLKNADFITESKKNRITITPDVGLSIQQLFEGNIPSGEESSLYHIEDDGRIWKDIITLDSEDGSAYFQSGKIGGWVIGKNGFSYGSTCVIKPSTSASDIVFDIGTNFKVYGDGRVVAKSGEFGRCIIDDKGNLQITAANITGTLNANQIDTTDLYVDAANITGKLTAGQIDASALTVGRIDFNTTVWGNFYIDPTGGSSRYIDLPNFKVEKTGYCTIDADCVINGGYLGSSTGGWNITDEGLIFDAAYNDGSYHWTELNVGCIMTRKGTSTQKPNTPSIAHWSDVVEAAICCSDFQLKNSIELIPSNYDKLFDSLVPKIFKYNDGTSDRYHTGFVAQDVVSSLEAADLTTQDFAAVCLGEIKEPGTKYWRIRYNEFVALNTWQIQKLKARVNELEHKIAELLGN